MQSSSTHFVVRPVQVQAAKHRTCKHASCVPIFALAFPVDERRLSSCWFHACLQEAPPAGVIAACVLVLAAAATSTIMRRRAEAAEQAVQQRRVMKQRAEELRAQKAVSETA